MVPPWMTKPRPRPKAGAIIVPVTLFEQNCTIIWHEPTKKAVVIDPGGDVPKIQAAIKQTGVTVEKIWLTHGHIDHVGGAADLRDALQVQDRGPAYRRQISARQCRLQRRALRHDRRAQFRPDRWLDEGDQVSIGELDLRHPALPRPFAGQRGVLQQGIALRPCRRRPVQRLGRPHRSARRQPRHADQVDQAKSCCRSATMSASSAATAPARASARSG